MAEHPRRPPKGRARRVASPRVRRRRAALFTLGLAVVVAGLLVVFVYPTSALLRQHASLTRAQHRNAILTLETSRIRAATRRLRDDGEIERIARQFYGLVRPGEQPYVVIPTTTTTTTPPPPPTAPGGLPNGRS